MAMYLCLHCATPSLYLAFEKGMLMSKTTARKTVVKRAIPQVILNNKELQPITGMYFW